MNGLDNISVQSISSGYRDRTVINAKNADLTVAFATDFSTTGEKLTRNSAGAKYVAIDLLTSTPLSAAARIYGFTKSRRIGVMNIAGNGLYTLAKSNWDQPKINQFIFETLRHLTYDVKLDSVRSGGQTGADIAGLVAAYALGLPVHALLPSGFLQRTSNGHDIEHSEFDIKKQIISGSETLIR